MSPAHPSVTTRLTEALAGVTFVGTEETELQAGVAELLEGLAIAYDAEAQLDERSRIDFLAGTTGIELKTQGSTLALGRQLRRYASSPKLSEILVITTNTAHRRELPPTIGGLPVDVVVVGGLR